MNIRKFAGSALLKLELVRSRCLWYVWSSRLGSLGKGAKLSRSLKFYVPNNIHIGNNVSINDFVHIWGGGGVRIGSHSLIAAHVVITSQTHDVEATRRGELYGETTQLGPVSIGDNVWIGSNATVLPGVAIGDGAVIGAGAVVTRDVPAYHLALGCPARVIRPLR